MTLARTATALLPAQIILFVTVFYLTVVVARDRTSSQPVRHVGQCDKVSMSRHHVLQPLFKCLRYPISI